MKYLIIGAITLIVTLLVSKLYAALSLVYFNKFDTPTTSKKYQSYNTKLEKTGKSLYLVYCSSCHGYDGKGNNEKAQNHTKRISKKSVLDVIRNGSYNFKSIYPSSMPAGLLNDKEAIEVATYVSNGMKEKKHESWDICASCHDESGEGIAFVAPNIKEYSDSLVATVLQNGKKGIIGIMPNHFKDRLSKNQMRALASYIRSIQK